VIIIVGFVFILYLLDPTLFVPTPNSPPDIIYPVHDVHIVVTEAPCNCTTTTLNAITSYGSTTHVRTVETSANLDSG
jgi:hypothetical protein